MNDDFLYRFQKSPRLEFESALYEKINEPMKVSRNKVALHRFGLSMGIVLSIFALTVIFVPTARAAVQSVIHKIAGLYFDEVTVSPIICDPMKCEPVKILGAMTLEQAQTALPFPINLPTWTPEGYWLNPKVKIYRSDIGDNTLEIEWIKTGFTQENHEDYDQNMVLNIWQDHGDYPTAQVGLGSVTEIEINGESAALIHGSWEPFNKNWNGNGATQITWVKDNVRYLLSAAFVEPSTVISDEDMVRIAESIP